MTANNTLLKKRVARHNKLPRKSTPADVAMRHAVSERTKAERCMIGKKAFFGASGFSSIVMIVGFVLNSVPVGASGIAFIAVCIPAAIYLDSIANKATHWQGRWEAYAEEYSAQNDE